MELKNYFKVPLLKADWNPSIREVTYIWADWKEHIWLEFEWYASTNEFDRWWDIVLPKAFQNTLSTYMENAMMLLQHDDDKPIWNFTEARMDSIWLFVKWLVKVDIDNVFQKLRTGVLKTMSIWYKIVDFTIDVVDWVEAFIIKELELFEISLVSVPMNAWAKIKSLNSKTNLSDEEMKSLYNIEKEDTYTFSKSIEDLVVKNNLSDNITIMKKQNKEAELNEEIKNTEIEAEVEVEKEVEAITEVEEIETKEYTPLTRREISIWDMVRYVKKQEDWYWDIWDSNEEEIVWDLKEAEVWEVIKMLKDNELAINTIWILKYELTMEWFKPTNEVDMFEFDEIEIVKVSNSQIKHISDLQIKRKELNNDDNTNNNWDAWDIADQEINTTEEVKVEKEVEVEAEVEVEVETKDINAWDIADITNEVETEAEAETETTIETKTEEVEVEVEIETKELKFDKKSFDDLVAKSVEKIEKSFFEHKENISNEIKSLFEEEKKSFTKELDDFAWVLISTLEVLQETNEKALKYVTLIENAPITKWFRFKEAMPKVDNALTTLIKQIKR